MMHLDRVFFTMSSGQRQCGVVELQKDLRLCPLTSVSPAGWLKHVAAIVNLTHFTDF